MDSNTKMFVLLLLPDHFVAKVIADALSSNTGVGSSCGNPSSFNNCLNQIISLDTSTSGLISASVDDKDTLVCLNERA